jgi:hypothetical protein
MLYTIGYMSKKFLTTILILLVLLAISVAVGYYFGPQITYQRKLASLGGKYKFDTPTGRVTEAKSVTITGCKANPVFAFTYTGSIVRFTNGDDRAHVVYFKQTHFTVPKHGFYDAKIDFLTSPGEKASYDCDSTKHIGVVSIFLASSTTTDPVSPKTSI